jgi:2-methylcitrate dehydratase PrpD
MNVTMNISEFTANTHFDDLPSFVVDETKRLLLDTIGCALGGVHTRKGEIAIQVARTLGGTEQSSLLGTHEKVSVASSSFATGELMNALDYEALLSPPDHATPYVLPALLAIGEMRGVSGRELIVATAVAHELATRIGSSLIFGHRFAVELPDKGMAMSLPTPGYGLCAFGGAAAAGRLLGFGPEKIAHAMGIAGYSAPVPMLMKFATTAPASMTKYLSAGMASHAQVLAVISAKLGYTGDIEVLDGNYGFWRSFGCDGWRPEYIVEGLGREWHFPGRIFYKRFPCCGAMQNALAHLHHIISENDLSPEQIEGITVKLNPLAQLPAWNTTRIESHIDVQFSVPLVFSIAAHRIEIGPSWQAPDMVADMRIREFMDKITVLTDLDDHSRQRPEVEVAVGKGTHKRIYSKSGPALLQEMTHSKLVEKFRGNTRSILGEQKTDKALTLIKSMDDIADIRELFACITPV